MFFSNKGFASFCLASSEEAFRQAKATKEWSLYRGCEFLEVHETALKARARRWWEVSQMFGSPSLGRLVPKVEGAWCAE